MKPLARHADLICEETGGELVVHDTRHRETHRLTPLASVVYRHADGRTSVTELVAVARAQLRRAVNKEMVISALDQLADAGLLMSGQQAPIRQPSEAQAALAG